MIDHGNPLPGKILVSNSQEHTCILYEDSEVPIFSFKERDDKEINYSVMAWLNTKDTFIGTEGIPGSTPMEFRCNIVKFDLSGKVIDRFYEAEKGEFAWPKYPSWDDRYLIFTTHCNVDPEIYPFEGLTPMVSLKIMDLEQKKVITQIDSIGRDPNFEIKESPWLHDNPQFVYSFYSSIQFKLEGEDKLINPVEETEGVYLYDVPSGERKLLVPGGHSAIASPTANQIAYEKDNSIRVLDLTTREEKTIYKHSPKVQLLDTHWTPDGKDIYFAYRYNWGILYMFNTGEKLVEVSTGKEKPFKKIALGFNSYTWK